MNLAQFWWYFHKKDIPIPWSVIDPLAYTSQLFSQFLSPFLMNFFKGLCFVLG